MSNKPHPRFVSGGSRLEDTEHDGQTRAIARRSARTEASSPPKAARRTSVLTSGVASQGLEHGVLTIEIVHARDPQASRAALLAAIEAATQTPQGRARLALIAALNTVTG
jgi:uncharacterized membrane-anchored protein